MGKLAGWLLPLILWPLLGSAVARFETPVMKVIALSQAQDGSASMRLPPRDLELYAQVLLVQGSTVRIAGAEILSQSSWLPYVLPGMWICAHGYWRNRQFVAQKVEVVEPARFTYYLGPAATIGLGTGWVEAWYVPRAQGGVTLWHSRKVVPANRAVLLAYHSRGIPSGVHLPAHAAREWIRAEGLVRNGSLVWQSVLLFPAGRAN